MMKIYLITLIAILIFFNFEVQPREKRPHQAFVFINSSVPEQFYLFSEFNQQYFMSITLQNTLEVKFIDISPVAIRNAAAVPIIHDIEGIWVDKFRPNKIPSLFCIHGSSRYQIEIKGPGDIRKCL